VPTPAAPEDNKEEQEAPIILIVPFVGNPQEAAAGPLSCCLPARASRRKPSSCGGL